MMPLPNYPKVSYPRKKETTQTLAGGVALSKRLPSPYANASFRSTATSFLIDVDGIDVAAARGIRPNLICISAAEKWGFAQSARIIVAQDGNPATLDFSMCKGTNVIVRFDNDTRYGWLAGITSALMNVKPRRLQLWNLNAREDSGEIFFMKLGGTQ